MKDDIILSPKYGLNPTLAVCAWCGEDRGDIALLGHVKTPDDNDWKAPHRMVISYEPCQNCLNTMSQGVTLTEVTPHQPHANMMPIQGSPENGNDLYPTGRWCVIKEDAVDDIFSGASPEELAAVHERKALFLDEQTYQFLTDTIMAAHDEKR